MKKISIKETFEEDHITREAGEKLRQMICQAIRANGSITLDFSDVTIASSSFFDEGIAKIILYDFTSEQINSGVSITNINEFDAKLLQSVCEYRGFSLTAPQD